MPRQPQGVWITMHYFRALLECCRTARPSRLRSVCLRMGCRALARERDAVAAEVRGERARLNVLRRRFAARKARCLGDLARVLAAVRAAGWPGHTMADLRLDLELYDRFGGYGDYAAGLPPLPREVL